MTTIEAVRVGAMAARGTFNAKVAGSSPVHGIFCLRRLALASILLISRQLDLAFFMSLIYLFFGVLFTF
jgi:hypothetical protein